MSAAVLADYRPQRLADRRFWTLVGLSLLLHGALFVGMAWQRKAVPVTLPPLVASIRMIVPVQAKSDAGTPPTNAPASVAAVPARTRQPVAVAQSAVPRVKPVAGPLMASEAAVSAIQEAQLPLPAVPATTLPAQAAVVPAVHDKQQADALAAYRHLLAQLFEGRQEYPRIAAMRGWEGEVRLRVKVARKGNLLDVALDRSSGFDVLDRSALALVESLAALPPLPEAIATAELQLVVPILYKLRKTI